MAVKRVSNIASTALALGLMVLPHFSPTTINANDVAFLIPPVSTDVASSSKTVLDTFSNVYTNIAVVDTLSSLELEARALFGSFRPATTDETMAVSVFIKSISKKTGVNLFDLC